MNLPDDLKYTASHEWIRTEADGSLTVGITDHAQEALGDIVYLDLPEAGRKVSAGDAIAVVESVKAASDIYAPVSGEILASNGDLAGAPETVNGEPYNAWLFKIKPDDAGAVASLLDAAAYREAAGD
ncbi:glycine cleavage system protein GcvH [Chitinasiproducens palmae]|uniref:Glycine cleavage system H protein n=1 Tax=Chitinasiproducens palmae TaxID=1770053 RepID=A0A1H2PP75_9BURK|nr:glycine cleavage system protein GcvH [Chitinasiproducens palmae]SDV48544.1 glycine cleavage system H protein [Chitinasiproducens palmae]